MRKAKIIIAPHGAGLTNIIFADQPTIIEIFGDYINFCYSTLAHSLGYDYSYIQARGLSTDQDIFLEEKTINEIICFTDSLIKNLKLSKNSCNISLKNHNFILCPDWKINEELLYQSICHVIESLSQNTNQEILLLFYIDKSINFQETQDFISLVIFDLLQQNKMKIPPENLFIDLFSDFYEEDWKLIHSRNVSLIQIDSQDQIVVSWLTNNGILISHCENLFQ